MANGSGGRGRFGQLGFIFAAVGSAIGLGNIWKFPYITYANDGGSFVLVYLAAIVLIGLPIMMAELVIGRSTRQSPVGAFVEAAKGAVGGKAWGAVGALGTLGSFILLSYYALIAGWTVYYFGQCLSWSFGGFDTGGQTLGDSFGAFLGNGPLQIGFHALFMAVTVGVVTLGVHDGIERVAKTLMPVLGAILILLVINSFWSPGFGEAVRFLFHVGPVTADGLLEAVGHAFFTLSVGMGAMITYGSYMRSRQSIPKSAAAITLLDTLVALMACIVMFSIIFSVDAAERTGTFGKSATILFTTLPQMFYEMPLGVVLAPLFYLLVGFAALTSTISLLEVVAAYLIDRRGLSRRKASLLSGGAVFLFGIPSALSLGAATGFSSWAPLGERTAGFFDTMDYTVSNWILPLGGLTLAIFVGWFLSRRKSREALADGHGDVSRWYFLWRDVLLRFVCPVAILWIIWAVIGGRSFA